MMPADQEALVAERLWVTRRLLEAMLVGDAAAIEEAQAAERALHARTAAALARGAHLPLAWPRRRLALTDTEEQVLWLLVAHELSPEVRRAIRALAAEELTDVSLDVLRRVVHGGRAELRAWRELAPGGTLRRACLVERTGAADAPAHRATFRAARRVLALAHGDTSVDEALAGLAARPAGGPRLDQLELTAEARDGVRAAFAREGLAILHGSPGSGRRATWLAAARDVGRELLVIDACALAADRRRAERQLRIVARECRLLELAPLILHLDALASGGAERPEPLERAEQAERAERIGIVEAELGGLVLATADRVPARRWRRPPALIELPLPGRAALARLWQRALPPASVDNVDLLARLFPLAPSLIRAAGAAAAERAAVVAPPVELQPAHVEAGVRAVLDERFAGLATRVPVTKAWADLVLPDNPTTALFELLARVRARRRVHEDWGFAEEAGRGPGVVAMFSGPPGTGKTLCAGLVAHELGAPLYRVDPVRFAAAWSGELERRLAALLDIAEAGHALVLFEDADALFGRRAPMWAGRSLRASPEASLLIRRLERFSGVCLLATSHEAAIDEALRSRVTVHVRFPVPEASERERLWRAMLPVRAPVAEELRLDVLARRYALTGGAIQNAVLRAAFLAADANEPISAELLAHAAHLEYEAAGRPASAEERVAR